ncbi:hypothetical protein ABPG75_000085 [Micractinium tetrahymenae]
MACFSSAQLSKFSEKRITQETFDAAVRENIEDFDMEPEEALKSAVEEFMAQGVNLSNIIQTASGGDISQHPAAKAVQELEDSLAAGDAAGMAAAAAAVAAAADGARVSSDKSTEVLAVLHRAGAAGALARAAAACSGEPSALAGVLRAAAGLLGSASRDLQAGFLQADGIEAVQAALGAAADNAALAAAALQVAAASATKNENGKAACMAAGLGGSCLEALRQHADQPEALEAACAVLCALTTADDDTLPASRAFPNARQLAKEGAALQLVAALRSHERLPQETTIALANALRQVAANDEICQEVAGAGGVQLALQVMEAGLADAVLARALCSLLRQLVSSDGNKALLVEAGGLELLARLLTAHGGSPAVLEQALGLLTNLTLRNPEAAEKALDCGCLDSVLELMRVMLAAGPNGSGSSGNGKENRGTTAAQRQACMALRNIAVRSPDVRAALLDKGAEALLRQVKAAYPACADAGSAALRDLGLDNYNS